jgi:hypothetical protein
MEVKRWDMEKILMYILIFIMAVFGGVSSFVVLLAVPGMIIYKVYRKIRYGCKLTD